MLSMTDCLFFFKQKTAYEMRISDWSSDVCSSDLVDGRTGRLRIDGHVETDAEPIRSLVDGSEIRARINLPDGFEYEIAEIGRGRSRSTEIGRASGRERVGQYV